MAMTQVKAILSLTKINNSFLLYTKK